MRITQEQRRILKSFSCKRLSLCEGVEKSIKSFESRRGGSLVDYLKNNGIKEDKSGESAFYLITNADDLPLSCYI